MNSQRFLLSALCWSWRKKCNIFVMLLFSATRCQPRALSLGGPGSCRLYHHTPAHKGPLEIGRYFIPLTKCYTKCAAAVVVKKPSQLHDLLLPLPFWWHEVFPWQMLQTTLTRLSVEIPLSRVGRIWWTWRKEATRTQTSTSLTSSRTVILKSSPGCQ